MELKFKNNVSVQTSVPIERKIIGDGGGWILAFSAVTDMTSSELDNQLNEDNISVLTLINGENERQITGYKKVTGVTIRYLENLLVEADIQLSK